jgi:hypothetical protein
MRRYISVILPVAYAVVRLAVRLAAQSAGNGVAVAAVDVAFLIGFLYTLSDDVERAVGGLGIHGIYNVMIVSWVAAIPQTVVAVYLASVGKYTAAFLDSMVSTLVDAFVVTALIRLKYLDAVRRDWHLIALWVATTLAFGALIEAPMQLGMPHEPYYWMWFLIGAAALPYLFSRGLPGVVHFDARVVVNLAVNTALIIYVSWDLGQALVTWHMSETQLGTIAAIVSTLPDLLTALIIRATLARLIEEYAAAEDAVRTMFAAAIHDQISIPALIIAVAPAAAGAFPHWLNIWVSVLKFTLLDRRVFLGLGLPPALITVIYLMLHQ